MGAGHSAACVELIPKEVWMGAGHSAACVGLIGKPLKVFVPKVQGDRKALVASADAKSFPIVNQSNPRHD